VTGIQEWRRAADYPRVPSFAETPSRLAIMILGSLAAYLLLGIPGVMGWIPGAWAAMSASTPWDDIDPADLSDRPIWAPIGEPREDGSDDV
jgi:hypothetical protein